MRNFFKQFFIYGLGSIIGKIAAIFLLPLYTNVLTQQEYGALAIIIAAKGVLDIFVNLNIHSGVAREYYEENVNRTRLISTGFWSILFFSCSVTGIAFFTKDFWVNNVLDITGYGNAFTLMLLTLPLGSLFSYFGILTRYQKKPLAYTIGSILQVLIQIGFTILFVLVFRKGIEGVMYGILIGHCFGFVFYFFVNKINIKLKFDKLSLKNSLSYSLPTLPAILAAWIDSSLGQILIGKYVSMESAGVYSIALRLTSVYLFVQVAFRNVWGPYIFENYKKETFKKELNRLFKFCATILVLATLHLATFSKELVLLFSNETYVKASEYLILLTLPFNLTILMLFVDIGPQITRRTIYISYANMLGSGINLIILFLLLPKYGVIVVPISLSISKLSTYFLMSRYTYNEIKYSFPYTPVLVIVLIVSGIFILFKNTNISFFIRTISLIIIDLPLVLYYFPTIKTTIKGVTKAKA